MPPVGVRNRWLVVAFACSVILAGVALGVAWWGKSLDRAGPLALGRAAYDRGDWAAAERIAREQLKKYRNDPDVLRLLSRALFRQSRDQPAVAISESLARDTMTTEDYFLLGQSCVRSQKVDLAIKLWQKAAQLDPDHVESRVALEQAFFRLDRLSEAEKEANALVALPGREALAELMRGQIRVQQSDTAGAAEFLVRAWIARTQWQAMVDPVGVRKQAARALLQMGQAARAREHLVRVTDSARDSETCWLLARCDLQESVPSEPAVAAQSLSYRESHPLEPEPRPMLAKPGAPPVTPRYSGTNTGAAMLVLIFARISFRRSPTRNNRSRIPAILKFLTRSRKARTASKCGPRSMDRSTGPWSTTPSARATEV